MIKAILYEGAVADELPYVFVFLIAEIERLLIP